MDMRGSYSKGLTSRRKTVAQDRQPLFQPDRSCREEILSPELNAGTSLKVFITLPIFQRSRSYWHDRIA